MPTLELHGVCKSFPGGVVGLKPTDLVVASGEAIALLGPTGSGKSTLLRLIAGLEDPTGGAIRIDGVQMNEVPPHRRGVAMLPQRVALYPHLNVEQNLAVGSGPSGMGLFDAAELLRIVSLLNRLPHQLSGGERQRIGLAKMLIRGAKVWLLDEPFGGLDPVFRAEFRHDLHLLHGQTGSTMLIVTHDPIDALALGRRIGVLGEGSIQHLGTPEELRDFPGNRFVAQSLGRIALIDGRVAGGDPPEFHSACGSVRMPLLGSFAPARCLTLGIRPADVLPVSPEFTPLPLRPGAVVQGWPVVSAEPVGSGWLLTFALGSVRVTAWAASGSPPRLGAPTPWFLPADRCLWFDGLTGRRIAD